MMHGGCHQGAPRANFTKKKEDGSCFRMEKEGKDEEENRRRTNEISLHKFTQVTAGTSI